MATIDRALLAFRTRVVSACKYHYQSTVMHHEQSDRNLHVQGAQLPASRLLHNTVLGHRVRQVAYQNGLVMAFALLNWRSMNQWYKYVNAMVYQVDSSPIRPNVLKRFCPMQT